MSPPTNLWLEANKWMTKQKLKHLFKYRRAMEPHYSKICTYFSRTSWTFNGTDITFDIYFPNGTNEFPDCTPFKISYDLGRTNEKLSVYLWIINDMLAQLRTSPIYIPKSPNKVCSSNTKSFVEKGPQYQDFDFILFHSKESPLLGIHALQSKEAATCPLLGDVTDM